MTQGIGIELSRRFYAKVVAPLLQENFPDLQYAAARIGLGSEVLGYDTEMSADHDYGPCVQIFISDNEFHAVAEDVMNVLDCNLPETFEGWAVRYPTAVRPPSKTAGDMLGSYHGAELYTLTAWCDRFLDRQFHASPTTLDWLSYPEQVFLIATAGAVYRDNVGELTALRDRLEYFPRDVWLYKLAAQWVRIAEDRAYIGRTGVVGDEIGSSVIAARMVGNIMRLAMLIERRYAPYPKWIGSAFSRLDCASALSPILKRVLSANCWEEREAEILNACRLMAEMQMIQAIPGAIAPTIAPLHARPFRFIDSVAISEALRSAITDPSLRELPLFGAADQFIGSSFVLAVPSFSTAAAAALMAAKLGEGAGSN